MRSMVLGTVVASKSSKFAVGDQATALAGSLLASPLVIRDVAYVY